MIQNLPGSQDYRRLPGQGSPRTHILPYLVIRIRETIDRPSQGLPIQASVDAPDKLSSAAPDQLGMEHVFNSNHKHQVQHENSYNIIMQYMEKPSKVQL